jgi:hypothetical protein
VLRGDLLCALRPVEGILAQDHADLRIRRTRGPRS